MKKLFALGTLALALTSAPVLAAGAAKPAAPASAQQSAQTDAQDGVLDMGSLTCAQLLLVQENELVPLLFWIEGYSSRGANKTVIKVSDMMQKSEALLLECGKNVDKKVLAIVK